MKLFGVTGGVGMGKSTCAELLLSRGIPVIDTDDLARQVVEPGQPALAEIKQVFGLEVLDPDSRLRRDVLARQVFANPAARKELEAILHPRIRQLWLTKTQDWRREGLSVGAVAIPLLYETNADKAFDSIMCVACSLATQAGRLRARGWPAEQIQQRIHAQLPIEEKMSRSHFVIWTEGSIEIHSLQLDRILRMS